MSHHDTTATIVDTTLEIVVTTSAIGACMVLPNLLIALEKPLNRYLDHLDKRSREREARRIISYMKSQGYLVGEYEHGLQITPKGYKRLALLPFQNLAIPVPTIWDKQWRIVFYDIPEARATDRKALTTELRQLGFFQLQRSVWIHPFPCRNEVEKVTITFQLHQYISYVTTQHLDNQTILIKHFRKRLPLTVFK